mgnify:CR=1 FL=1
MGLRTCGDFSSVVAVGAVLPSGICAPSLPHSAVALLSVRKLCSAGMLGPRTCDGVLHVVRHKRRRLGLSVVEVRCFRVYGSPLNRACQWNCRCARYNKGAER